MKNKLIILIIQLIFVNLPVYAGFSEEYSNRISGFLVHNFNYNHVGIVVQSLSDNKVLYQQNANQLFIPASLVKLFTLAGSLEELTPKFKFKTSIKWNPSELKNELLKGDLAILFSGDPSFSHKDLKGLINSVKQHKIKTIAGDLIVDDTLFSDLYADGWTIDDLSWGYAAPSGAVVIAENKLPIKIQPITTLGQKVEFLIDDYYKDLYPFNISSQVVATTKQQSDYNCKLNINVNSQNHPFFSGCAQIDNTTQKLTLALNSPNNYLRSLLQLYLREANVTLMGNIVFNKVPEEFVDLKVHESPPLFDLLKIMMKNSNNIYAHSIGKAIGLKLYGMGSFKTSTNALRTILQKKFTVNTSTLDLVDTSGLSNYNLASPNHFIRLLQAIHNDYKLKNHVNKILSKSGQDGTLKNRLAAKDLKDLVLAKTGNLKNSSGIAGYITTKRGRLLAFVFMVNNILEERIKVKQLTDELCELLVNYG
jgi:serine-type D-Ala-D-Ala carboxypeptidase/endopeptidase (penicillin-binding protein 4)